jgi:hypothetical protein
MSDKKELENLGRLNGQFIKSLMEVIEPFVKKLEALRENNVELNESELKNLNHTIDVIKIYSSKEASLSKYLSNKTEKEILNEINYELVLVKAIASDAEKGKLDQLYRDCEHLQTELLKIEDLIVFKVNMAA